MAETRDLDASMRRRRRLFFVIVGAAVLATIVGVGLLVNIFGRKQGARNTGLFALRRPGRCSVDGAGEHKPPPNGKVRSNPI
mgnify:CR=1 FL=1